MYEILIFFWFFYFLFIFWFFIFFRFFWFFFRCFVFFSWFFDFFLIFFSLSSTRFFWVIYPSILAEYSIFRSVEQNMGAGHITLISRGGDFWYRIFWSKIPSYFFPKFHSKRSRKHRKWQKWGKKGGKFRHFFFFCGPYFFPIFYQPYPPPLFL